MSWWRWLFGLEDPTIERLREEARRNASATDELTRVIVETTRGIRPPKEMAILERRKAPR